MYDVIVAGAGPAGATCARICAKSGLRTLLLDKAHFPRPKPCGGAVSVRALSFLDFPIPADLVEEECCGAQVFHGTKWTEIRKEGRIALFVDRARFDHYLAAQAVAAGARFVQSERVTGVHQTGTCVVIRTEKNSYEAGYVIGADGVHSRVARSIRNDFRSSELVLAAVSNISAPSAAIEGRIGKGLALYFGVAPMGYGWLFPGRSRFSLGVAGLASRFSDVRKTLETFSQEVRLVPGKAQGRFIPLGGIRRRIASGRILLAGDAAGFADPIHGEGIVYAILSGRLAAEALVDGIRNKRAPAETVSRYVAECERRIRKQLRIALLLARLFDRVPGPFVRIFLDNKIAIDRYLEIAAGRSDYDEFLRWLAPRIPSLLLSSLFAPPRAKIRPAG